MNYTKSNNSKILYFDILRILAAFGIIILHTSAKNWYNVSFKSLEWNIFNFFDSIVRWCVPIFVMISGALFLSKEHSLKKLYTKNIFRIAIAFLFWSLIYAIIDLVVNKVSFKEFLLSIIKGHYHMWFLPMIIGIYIVVPFLKKITESETLEKYFLILALIITFIIPEIISLISFQAEKISTLLNNLLNRFHIYMPIGYVSYFVLGNFLHNKKFSKKERVITYILGTIGFVSTIFLSKLISAKLNYQNEFFYGVFTLNVLLESISVFVFFKYLVKEEKFSLNLQKIINKFSKYSFGAYLCHALIIEQLDNLLGINSLSFSPWISVPCISIIVLIISFGISTILNNIPFFNKYIV